jgi:protein TonB
MALQLLENRGRALGVAGTIAVHAIVIGVLLFLAPGPQAPPAHQAALVTVDISEPPPPAPPPPDEEEEGAAAPPSRGNTEAPAPPPPPRPIAKPTPAEVSVDPGSQQGSGFGVAAGSGAGQGGEGNGSGAGGSGSGRGSGAITPPVQIAGALTNADSRSVNLPRRAQATVEVSFVVRTNGLADQCRVIVPSGNQEVDRATCRLIQQRFRFRPALDAAGRPIEWVIRTDYTWGRY